MDRKGMAVSIGKRILTADQRSSWGGLSPAPATSCYWSVHYRERVIDVLRARARYLVDTTYMFAHFEEYLRQKRSDRPEDKCEVYWTAEYYEKPMDQIRIIAAVENSLKAMMLERGYMVHYIREAEDTRHFAKMQAEGRPVPIDDFLLVRDFMTDVYTHHPVLEGLRNEWKTIEAKHLLMEPLTTLFNMDEQFVHLLKRIQRDRNRVHFMIDYPGAHRVNQYIDEWTFVRDQCRLLTESEKH